MAEDDRIIEAEEVGFPPQPPEVGRRPKLHLYQWFGLPLMAAVVIAAVAGAFGETREEVSTSVDGLRVEGMFPTRVR